MMKPWNLAPEKWSDLLLGSVSPEQAAEDLKRGRLMPWALSLQHLTADVESVLDLGSGRGEHSAFLALHGRETTLTDWSNENLEFSKKLFGVMGLGGKFLRVDITTPLPFKEGAFDAVFSCGVFEYFTDEVIQSILKESFRVSKKKVIILVPNALSIAYRVGKWYMEKTKRWPWGGERPFRTLKPSFRAVTKGKLSEFTVDAQNSLNFLTMPGGERIKNLLIRTLRLKYHSRPVLLKQGYLLVTIGEKA